MKKKPVPYDRGLANWFELFDQKDSPEEVCRKLNAVSKIFGMRYPDIVCMFVNSFVFTDKFELFWIPNDTYIEFGWIRRPREITSEGLELASSAGKVTKRK
jgi:hypothetical protein